MAKSIPQYSKQQVIRLWLQRQGLLNCHAPRKLSKKAFSEHLETTGGLQVDSVNVLDRAHYLTLWSRFGNYNRALIDRWIYRDRVAYEYWGHEASILPISHLPFSMRRMRRFPPERWKNASYWSRYATSPTSKRRVMRLIEQHGPLESANFDPTPKDREHQAILGWGSVIPKEDKRSLGLLWHAGKLAISHRNSFRKHFDLASRVYPSSTRAASLTSYFDSWLLTGLSGNGIASESHLFNYLTAPHLTTSERKQVIERNLRKKKICQVRVDGLKEPFYALPEHLDSVAELPEPHGTSLLCPFDSLLWQRRRAEELLDFRYRVEIYVPEAKREFGYYVLPILHRGKLVGRVDPKLHRDQSRLEIKNVFVEPNFKPSTSFAKELGDKLQQLAEFTGAASLTLPPKSKWRTKGSS